MGINPGPNGMNNYPPLNSGYINGGMLSATSSNLPNFSPASIVSSLQSLCCLVDNGVKCSKPSGNASYSKRIEKQVLQRKLRLAVDQRTPHTYICEHHKQVIQSIRTSGKRKRKDDDQANDDDMSMNDFHDRNDSSNDHHPMGHHSMGFASNSSMKSYNSHSMYDIDLHTLQVNTLRRYKRHYRVSTKPGINKTQLAEELSRHFRTIQVNEKEVINTFIYTIKYNGNKLDFNQNNKNAD